MRSFFRYILALLLLLGASQAGATNTHRSMLDGDSVVTTLPVVTSCYTFSWEGQTVSTPGNHTLRKVLAAGSHTGADSIVLQPVVIYDSVRRDIRTEVCDRYVWNGVTYTSAAQSGTYRHTETSHHGCDSNVYLHLTINNSFRSDETFTVCDSIHWMGRTYRVSGSCDNRYTSVKGCDSVYYLHLTVNYSRRGTTNIHACDSYTWMNHTYTASALDTTHILTTKGCDSTLILRLSLDTTRYTIIADTVCDSYTWDREDLTRSGVYRHTYFARNRCDSLVTLRLTVNYSDSTHFLFDGCDEVLDMWNGNTYLQTTTLRYLTINRFGCDSLSVIDVIVRHNDSRSLQQTVCDSMVWDADVFRSSGTYLHYRLSPEGCPSSDTLHLVVKRSTSSIEVAEACNSYTWESGNGQTYTQVPDVAPTVTLTNAAGCDSTITLHLTLFYSTRDTLSAYADTAYTWIDGVTYHTTGCYTYTIANAEGCDSLIVLNLYVEGSIVRIDQLDGHLLAVNHYVYGHSNPPVNYYDYRWFHNGERVQRANHSDYLLSNEVLNGAYYVEVPIDAGRTRWIRSNVINITSIGDVSDGDPRLWPNPVASGALLHIQSGTTSDKGTTCAIHDLQGRLCATIPVHDGTTTVPIDLLPGVYTLSLRYAEGTVARTRFVVR